MRFKGSPSYVSTEDLTLASMTEAALTAAAIANDKTAKARVQAITPMNLKNNEARCLHNSGCIFSFDRLLAARAC